MFRTPRHRAVTLQDVLVVVAIVLFILALLIPGLNNAREQARRVVCSNNLRQWGFALSNYRSDYRDRIPMEGLAAGKGDPKWWTAFNESGTWYNELPAYLGLPAYRDAEHDEDRIRDFPELHVWICPSKNRMRLYKSGTGKNQFHYAMNQVLDGIGPWPDGSADAPGFPDADLEPDPAYKKVGDKPPTYPLASVFAKKPRTVFLFDVSPNLPGGTPRDVATRYQRDFDRSWRGEYHGDYANLLFIDGSVGHCVTDDLVTGRDFRRGKVVWNGSGLYWGYPRP